jgi:hypothetical protein
MLLPPNKPFQLTPLCGRKIGGILKTGNSLNAFPIKNGGAAERQGVGLHFEYSSALSAQPGASEIPLRSSIHCC